ncbi:phosphatase PAP2 family protein [Actinospongicola halichondriae]|uniref:phosphatase PAP2 family protein n=1 Tax=Actinospongicola halichondriae TaxID=3236844 RepID=UPI003D407C7F
MTLVRRLAVAALVVSGLGLLLSLVVRIGSVADADRAATRWLHDRAIESDAVSRFALDVTAIGNPLTLTAFVVITAGWLLFHRRGRAAVWLVAVTLVASVVESLLKVVVGRARPDFDSVFLEPVTRSFPSGHAMNTTVVLGAIAVAVVTSATSRRSGVVPLAAAVAAIVAFAVGTSRPILGVHFVSDVVAGWALGVIWLLVTRPRADDDVDREVSAEQVPASA